jgi:hypothetical protein
MGGVLVVPYAHNAICFSITSRTNIKGAQILYANTTSPARAMIVKRACFQISLVELKVSVRLLHIGSVAFLEVLGENDIPVLAYCMHACFLADSCDL